VIQRRDDGKVDFFCDWAEYKGGFGNLSADFWLGLPRGAILICLKSVACFLKWTE